MKYMEIISITVWAEDRELEGIVRIKTPRGLRKKIGQCMDEAGYESFKEDLEDYKAELEKKYDPERYYVHAAYWHHLRKTKKEKAGFLKRIKEKFL